jgi:hypothetical protein
MVMRLLSVGTIALALTVLASGVTAQQDLDRVVPGGGITGAGWKGNVVDANSIKQGRSINDSKFALAGNTITINAGPNNIYWNPANVGSGDFTVKATFAESNHLKHSGHPHPYGLFIGGANLETAKPTLLYCSAYGNGTFIVRGFAPDAPNGLFRLGGARPTPNDAIKKAGPDGTVTQEIAMSVKGGNIECAVNGTVVGTHPVADAIGAGKLPSTNGIVGLRIGHNLDVVVTGFAVSK